jgi:hypothetical protein
VHQPLAHGEEGIGIHPVIEGVKRGGLGAEKKVKKGEDETKCKNRIPLDGILRACPC